MDILEKLDIISKEISDNDDRDRKKTFGQFFTPSDIAKYMAKYASVKKNKLRILEPGAGSGILAIAILDEILLNDSVSEVYIELYEIDYKIIELLKSNLNEMKYIYKKNKKELIFKVKQLDFITSNAKGWINEDGFDKFDIVLSNPPYKKISKKDEKSKLMSSIIFGQPNIYYLFMAMAIKLLDDEGQFIFITPRSYFTGAYFREFRKWFLPNVNINNIDILESRKNTFGNGNVLQETVIINGKKEKQKEFIQVRKINRLELDKNVNVLMVEKDLAFEGKENFYIKSPTSIEEYNCLRFLEKWSKSLKELGIMVSTGKVVPFRCKEYLSNIKYDNKNGYPLIWDINLKNGVFSWPIYYKDKFQYTYKENDTIDNLNYLFIKRISSKEEKRRIQVTQYYQTILKDKKIGLENHVNYMYKINGQLDRLEMTGLYIIFNSNIVDNYFKVLCGSTQVNATEINSIKLPNIDEITDIGKIGQDIEFLSSEVCDEILIKYFK